MLRQAQHERIPSPISKINLLPLTLSLSKGASAFFNGLRLPLSCADGRERGPRVKSEIHAMNWLCRASRFRINEHMKQLLVEIDEDTFKKLEQIAPARSRRRSAFIRAAIHKAIYEERERATAEAYRGTPDSAADAWFDARVWEPKPPAYRGRRRR